MLSLTREAPGFGEVVVQDIALCRRCRREVVREQGEVWRGVSVQTEERDKIRWQDAQKSTAERIFLQGTRIKAQRVGSKRPGKVRMRRVARWYGRDQDGEQIK